MSSTPKKRKRVQVDECNNNNIYINGTPVKKKFNGVTYEGFVKYYDVKNKWYRIVYKDGDDEDMSHRELQRYIIRKKRLRRGRVRNNRTTLGQTNLHGEILPAKDLEAFGHDFPERPNDNCSIITFQNIGQQPKSKFEYKATTTARAFKASKASIALYAELSINESKLPPYEKFSNRMKQYNPKSLSYTSSNQHQKEESPWNRVGGTAITIDEGFASHRTSQGTGRDKTGLGRWIWTRVRGCDQIHTRIISAYRPCKSSGINSTWIQHINYFRREKDIEVKDPRDKFDDDLIKEIKQWLELGDNVILGIDMNEDIRTGKLARRLKELGLREIILSTHPDASPPATFSGNNSRTPIDGFFGSEGVEVLRAGYTPFDQVIPAAPSDGHRLIWLETCNFSILGKEIPHSTKPCPSKGPNS